MISRDFSLPSTGFDVRRLKRLTGLNQVVDAPTRNNAMLDWCLVNARDPVFQRIQLPPIGCNDHNAIVIKSYTFHVSKILIIRKFLKET